MLQLLLTALLSVSAFAKDPCAVIMENEVGGKFQDKPDLVALFQAEQWLADYGHAKFSSKDALLLYRNWQKWNTVNDQQRDHTLALELKLISPAEDSRLFLWNGRAKLNELSKENLKRLLLQLKIRHPETANSPVEQQAATISQLVKVSYSLPLPTRPLDGVTPPLPSPRELAKNGLTTQQVDYYSSLLNGSPSAAFRLKLNSGNTRSSAIYLREDVAQTQGFVIPHFDNAEALLAFFAVWDLEALDQVVRYNRMSFPFSVKTGRQMLNYFDPDTIGVEQVFPMNAPEKLSALREKLRDYILTEEDARTFIREAFQIYAMSLAQTKPADYSRLASQVYGKIPPGDQIFRKFFDFINFPGLTLRLPVAVKASDYTLEREAPRDQGLRAPPFSGMNSFQRRVDHDSKP